MKKIFLLFGIIISTISNAQTPLDASLTMNYGFSKPMGVFASKNPNNTNAGFAENGLFFDLSLLIKFGKKMGFATTYISQNNWFDDLNYSKYSHDEINVTVDKWKINGIMLGGVYTTPISSILDFETKALFGFLDATIPAKYIEYDANPSKWQKVSSSSSNSFSFLLNMGLKIKVSPRIHINILYSFLTSNPEFTIQTNDYLKNETFRTYNQPFQTINLTMGFGIKLGPISQNKE